MVAESQWVNGEFVCGGSVAAVAWSYEYWVQVGGWMEGGCERENGWQGIVAGCKLPSHGKGWTHEHGGMCLLAVDFPLTMSRAQVRKIWFAVRH